MNSFRSARFGDLEYRADRVITLPEGLVGLPRLRRWIMLDMDRDLPLKWLQSLDDAAFGLPVVSPEFYDAEAIVDEVGEVAARLGGAEGDALAILIITTVHAGGTRLTGNLAAPLVVHTGTRRGAQLVLGDPRWSLRQEIDYARFGLAVQASAVAGLSQPLPAAADRERQEIIV